MPAKLFPMTSRVEPKTKTRLRHVIGLARFRSDVVVIVGRNVIAFREGSEGLIMFSCFCPKRLRR